VTARVPDLSAPRPLAVDDELEEFGSGTEPLDTWLKRHAHHNEQEGGSRTFVVCSGRLVVGYYSLAAGSVRRIRPSGCGDRPRAQEHA